jgi:carboxynorspermidine decarboxylase
VAAFEDRFGDFIPRVRWINFGGGHHITRPDYDRERLVRVVRAFTARWDKRVYLEPGEAIALGAGVLVASVMDTFENGMPIAILDTSATAHMPDVLEMPYRPVIVGAGEPGAKRFTYRLGGMTCLAGDVIGDYSFDHPLAIGERLVFLDMAHYTMVKTTTFNGVRLPAIATHDPATHAITVRRRFGYRDYRDRLS